MATAEEDALKVFICYARADTDSACNLRTQLVQDGMNVWLDEENIRPGQDDLPPRS